MTHLTPPYMGSWKSWMTLLAYQETATRVKTPEEEKDKERPGSPAKQQRWRKQSEFWIQTGQDEQDSSTQAQPTFDLL